MQLEDSAATESNDDAMEAPEVAEAPAETSAEPEQQAAPPSFEPPSTEERNAAERIPSRRENKAARGKIFEENKNLQRLLLEQQEENRRINAKLAESLAGMQRSFEASRPKEPSAREKASAAFEAKARDVFARLDQNDPSAFKQFIELVQEGGRIGSMDLIEERVNEVRRSMPQPKSQFAAKLEAEFSWLPEHSDGVNTYINRLAATKYKGRDLSDKSLLYAVAREAAALYARHWELPVESSKDANAPKRLAGSSGRQLGGGSPGAGAGGLDSETLAKIDAAAAVQFPSPNMTTLQKRAAWLEAVKKNQPKVYQDIVGS